MIRTSELLLWNFPVYILMQDLALSTRKKYFRMFQKWETWAKQKKVSVIPAQPIFFNLFLLFRMKKESSFSTFSGFTSAVAWAHKKIGLYSPTENAMTKQLIRAGQRILGCATAKGKHPLKVEHLKALQDKFAFASLDQLQIITLATLGFAGFLRWDDLSQIKTRNIDFHRGFIKIFLEKRKNDQFTEGSWIYIAETETRYCPVGLLKCFIQAGEHSLDSFLFRKISHTKADFKLRKQKLSYSGALELFKKQLEKIHLDPSLYGLHSLRSGGASLAASIEIPDCLIMRHGGWRSEGSKNRYINESIDSLLRISKASGL